METILDKIVQSTGETLKAKKRLCPFAEISAAAERASADRASHRFIEALSEPGMSVIAEIKKASPSKGQICADFDPVTIAREYEQGGASAISVLTEERYFSGHIDFLRDVNRAVSLPLLRKDFIIDPYQICEGVVYGAGAILLICAALDDNQLKDFIGIAASLGVDALVEVHNRAELDRALSADSRIVGINNRDLKTFSTDIRTGVDLARYIPDHIIKISESGIQNRSDVERLERAGFDAILVGESLMRHPHRAALIEELRGR
jgi:indole-3-glycerol phosphate synthase